MPHESRKAVLLTLIAPMALLCLAPAPSPSAESILEAQPPELEDRLRQERVVVLEDVSGTGPESFIVALVLFTQSHGKVLGLIREAERQSEYRPELVGVQTVERFPGGRIDEQRIKILFAELVYRLRYQEEEQTGRITWTLDETFENDISSMDGFWELFAFEKLPGYTLGRFGSSVDVGKGVPRFVQKGMSRKTVLGYVRNVRQWVDADGEWRP